MRFYDGLETNFLSEVFQLKLLFRHCDNTYR